MPKEVALPESVKDVEIIKNGYKRIIILVIHSWEVWLNAAGVSDDFMQDPEQSANQVRESI